MNKARRAVSRQDVARLAGVSKSAVSLVLNNTPGTRISEETRERIRNAADQLGYRPSAAARAVSTGKTNTIGVLLCNDEQIFERYTANILQGVWPTLLESSFRMTIDALNDDNDAGIFFRERAADGVLLLAGSDDVNHIDLLVRHGYPTVSVGTRLSPEIDYADLDNVQAAELATNHLIENGHTKIAHMSGAMNMSPSRDRLQGFRNAMTKAGLEVDDDLLLESEYASLSADEHSLQMLERKDKFTAVFGGSDEIAISLIKTAEREGLSVPDDFSVIGINGFVETFSGGILTTVKQPFTEIGQMAAILLLERIDGYAGIARERLLPGELVVGDSVRKLD